MLQDQNKIIQQNWNLIYGYSPWTKQTSDYVSDPRQKGITLFCSMALEQSETELMRSWAAVNLANNSILLPIAICNVRHPKVITSAHSSVRPIVILAVIFEHSFVEARNNIL